MFIDPSLYAGFVSFAVIASITPGPNNLMVMASGAAFGWRKSLPHVAGIALGAIVMLVATNLGLGALFERLPILAVLLRIGGAIWLLWLSWQLAKPALFPAAQGGSNQALPQHAAPMSLMQAALFQWVNPKTWTIMVAVSGAFADLAPSAGVRAIVMAGTFAVVAPLCNGAWLFAGEMIRTLLSDPRTGRIALLLMALLVALSAGLILFG